MNHPPTPDELTLGSRWTDTEAGNRVVVLLGPGGNGLAYRYEDDGSEWHCCAEDWTVWKRFMRVA